MVVGVFHEASVDFHLAPQYRFERLRHLVPRRDFAVACSEFAVWRDHTQFFLPRDRLFAQLVPALIELALVLVGPFLRYMVWRMCCTGREVDEERLVGCESLLHRDPFHRLVCHVIHEGIAFLGCFLKLDGSRAFKERWIPLIRLAADETVEVFEAAATRGPGVERPGRARFPDRHFMALAKLCRGVAVELERPRE